MPSTHEIARRFPGLRLDRVREVAQMVADERNEVTRTNQAYRSSRWGLACLAYDVVMQKVHDLHRAGTHQWLRFVGEQGMAYTVLIDSVPLRLQRDDDRVRDVMPGERAAQLLLANVDASDGAILRLEVAHRPGFPVDQITLSLYDETKSATLDSIIVYRRDMDLGATDDSTPPANGSSGAAVLPLGRRAQDVDPTTRFEFDDADDMTTGNDNGGAD